MIASITCIFLLKQRVISVITKKYIALISVISYILYVNHTHTHTHTHILHAHSVVVPVDQET